MDPVRVLSIFQMALLYRDDLPSEDADYVFKCLQSSRDDVVMAAATVLSELGKPALLRVIHDFDNYPSPTQDVLIMFLSLSRFVECYVFLLDRLETTRSTHHADYICTCLSKTDYLLFPLLLTRLKTEELPIQHRYETLFKRIGFTKLEPYLATLPSVPHERFFRRVFGDVRIRKLKEG